MRKSGEAGPDVSVPLAGLPPPTFARMTLDCTPSIPPPSEFVSGGFPRVG